MNFSCAQSTLVRSEGSVEIRWLKDSTESVSKLNLEKQGALESLGFSLVREKDVLIEVLGSPEQTGRMCGVSSYSGWKHWPNCTGMYRKRKQSTSDVDVEAIKEEVKSPSDRRNYQEGHK